ncbi:TonB-dependent receptor domain-containing protein [Aureivirga sp. CE67]|uniref:TonB-dependent receptor n=1 Tax=Aureivirga sp. CE67 TaxID=1788983 RepID=UPI0018CAB498|nr:TonB-dependent receptor [Aureivirga sp. CE67]
MKAKISFSIFFFFIVINSFGQFRGKVLDNETKQPLRDVLVKDQGSLRWTVTNENGYFEFPVKVYPITFKFHLLGKVDVIKTYKSLPKENIIYLKEDNLKIDEVVVTAKRSKKSTGSNIVLEKQAIELVQAQSLADVMQLIPGKSISESNLHERQILTLRTAIFDEGQANNTDKGLGASNNPYLINNSFGVGYVIDGVPINNNVSLSGGRGSYLGIFNNATANNSVGMGLDLKNLSLENIESIDIVQGISSAKYGDHNTGLIKINKAHGHTPFRFSSTLRGGSIGASLSKGVSLGENTGFLNLGLDYLKSDSDPRNSISNFDRINFSSSWFKQEKGKYRNTLSFSYGQHLNADNSVANSISDRRKKVDNNRFRISNNHKRYYKNSFVNELEALVSLDYSINKTFNSVRKNNGGEPVLNSYTEGTYEATYTPVAFRAHENIENKPFSFFTKIEASKVFSLNETKFKISLGGTFGIDKNFGRGNFNEADQKLLGNSSSSGGSAFRNVNFNDIVPADKKISTYLTTNIKSTLFGKLWASELGLRYDNYNKIGTFSPRFNTTLKFNNQFKARFGFGLFAKSPALQTLFPGEVYYDYVLADYRTNQYSFALAHTFVREYENPDIKPSKTIKYETGFDYNHEYFHASVTGYFNKQYDGFTNQSTFEIAELPVYEYTFYEDRKPDYVQTGTTPTVLRYSKPTNALNSKNLGLELLIGTRKIKAINTRFSLSGSYRYTNTFSDLDGYVFSEESDSEAFIGVHKATPNTYETINSSITATHHISSIGLVITLTAEQFWMSNYRSSSYNVNPFAYYDRDLNYFEIPESERGNDKYIPIRRSASSAGGVNSNRSKIFANYHLKLAKEFDNGLRVSFYAVNFLNHLPKLEEVNSDGTISIRELNRPISFGGSITYKF